MITIPVEKQTYLVYYLVISHKLGLFHHEDVVQYPDMITIFYHITIKRMQLNSYCQQLFD